MKRCPMCGSMSFYVHAHVIQDWAVDENGSFMDVIDDCIEVIHYPDDEDMWECQNCGHSARGGNFNVQISTTDPIIVDDFVAGDEIKSDDIDFSAILS